MSEIENEKMNNIFLVEVTNFDTDNEVPKSQQHSPQKVIAAVKSQIPIALETLSDSVKRVIDSVQSVVKPSNDGPESCELKFGLTVSAEGNVLLAKIGSELNLEITVTWRR